MNKFAPEFALVAAVVALATIYLWADSRLPASSLGDPLGPRVFPALVGGGLLLAALLLLVETLRKKRAIPEEFVRDDKSPRVHPGVLIAMVAWIALYDASLETAGYLVATFVFLMGLLARFHRGHLVMNLGVALAFTLVVDALFTYALGVPMPAGWLAI